MPVVPGKPGSIKLRGKIRAQLQVCFAKCQEIIAYNTKLAARTPPVQLLTPAQLADFQTTAVDCTTLLDEKN
jgi:hypothetical protein